MTGISQKNKMLMGLFYVLLFGLLALPNTGFGAIGDGDVSAGIQNPLGSEFTSLSDFVKALVDVARDIGVLVAVLGIVYAGFLKVTARGDEEKLKKANKAFLWAVIGTAVLLGAWLIATAIQGTVTELETGEPQGHLIVPEGFA